MDQYIQDILAMYPEDMDGEAITPTPMHLFNVKDDTEKLVKSNKELYVTLVVNILYLLCHVRPNIRTAVSFLTTKTNEPDKDGY